jgi:hypothetical protein
VALIAAAPGLVVLQLLPRLIEIPANAGFYGIAGIIAPFLGAAMGGAVARFANLTRGGLIAGAASQAPAMPAYVETMAGYLEFGFLLDAVLVTALLISYVAIAVFIGEWLAAQPRAIPRPAGYGLAGLLAVCGLLLVTNPVTSWTQAAFLFAGAAALLLPRARRAGKSETREYN